MMPNSSASTTTSGDTRPVALQTTSVAMSSSGITSATGNTQPTRSSIGRLRPTHELFRLHADLRSFAEHREVFAQIQSLTQLRSALLSFQDRCDRTRRQQPAGQCVLSHARARDRQQLEQIAGTEQIEIGGIHMMRIVEARAGVALFHSNDPRYVRCPRDSERPRAPRVRAFVARGSDRSQPPGRELPASATNGRPTISLRLPGWRG